MKRTRRAKPRKPAGKFVELARQLRHQLHDIDQKLEHLSFGGRTGHGSQPKPTARL